MGRQYRGMMTCEKCGEQCLRTGSMQRWCIACRPRATLDRRATHIRERRRRNPVLFRARERAWVKANPERWKAAQDRHHLRPCPGCGKVRKVNRAGKEAKDKVFCHACELRTRPKKIARTPCYWCFKLVERCPSDIHKGHRHWHTECLGSLTRAGVTLGITRERVRQLVNREYARLNQNGYQATRAEALASVMAARKEGKDG